MNKSERSSGVISLYLIISFLVLNLASNGQGTGKVSSPLPENISKIVSTSCTPCHFSNGGMLSRAKLNFTEWNGYSAAKQKEKANKIYYELSENAMPPKSARKTRPDIIPTREQIDSIKKWVDSFGVEK